MMKEILERKTPNNLKEQNVGWGDTGQVTLTTGLQGLWADGGRGVGTIRK